MGFGGGKWVVEVRANFQMRSSLARSICISFDSVKFFAKDDNLGVLMSIVCSVYVCDECAARYVYDEMVGLRDGPREGPTPPYRATLSRNFASAAPYRERGAERERGDGGGMGSGGEEGWRCPREGSEAESLTRLG